MPVFVWLTSLGSPSTVPSLVFEMQSSHGYLPIVLPEKIMEEEKFHFRNSRIENSML